MAASPRAMCQMRQQMACAMAYACGRVKGAHRLTVPVVGGVAALQKEEAKVVDMLKADDLPKKVIAEH